MGDDRPRGGKSVIEEPEVLETVEHYRKTVYGFDDAYRALIWYLAHDGEGIKGECITIDKTTYYVFVQKPNKIMGTPRLRVVYRSTDSQVTIVGLSVVHRKDS
jgi:hypothetical protein